MKPMQQVAEGAEFLSEMGHRSIEGIIYVYHNIAPPVLETKVIKIITSVILYVSSH